MRVSVTHSASPRPMNSVASVTMKAATRSRTTKKALTSPNNAPTAIMAGTARIGDASAR